MNSVAIDQAGLDQLMPMHLRFGLDGKIVHTGPSLQKIHGPEILVKQEILEVINFRRPRDILTKHDLPKLLGQKIFANFVNCAATGMPGLVVKLSNKEFLLNLSLGSRVVKALHQEKLRATDFAPTDAALDMLYLIEVQQMVLKETRGLNNRLNGAKQTAEQQATTDSLTGLTNRRALRSFVHNLNSAEPPVGFGLILIDLDYFKQVNDRFGHAAGDHVLKEVANRLLDATRSCDLVARVGGDEFVLVLTDIEKSEDLEKFATRLIERLKEPIQFGKDICQIGASIGASLIEEGKVIDLAKILEFTDRALYQSKERGRGRVTLTKI